ncbi:MAG: hypothetical protein IKY78_06345, partial [Clostridia bacterium]|nr:hypothetical protein [Clostridia bacterium]
NVTSTLGKITVFKGIKNTQEAEKYQIIDVVCNESFDLFWEKTEYDEATGEKSIYTANNAFTQQPSADNNLTVDFNNTAATFQWYEVEEEKLGTYIVEEHGPLFSHDFKAGDILKVSTDSELRHVVIETGIIDTDYEYINLRENEKTATITFDADTTVDLFVAIVNADNPVEVNFTVFKEAKLDGETEKTLQKVECGKSYYCKATVGENVYISDTVNILPVEHDLIQVDAKAPTCTEIGWDAYEYCTTCTYTTYVELPVDADAHDWSNKDGICKLCGADCEHESYTDGVCDVCGYECPHTETYETVTQLEHFSVQNPDGTWTKATVGVVCWECYKILEEKEADRADYTEFDEIMAKICEYLDSGKLIDNAYNSYSSTINSFKNNIYIIGSPFQSTPDSYVESLKYMLNEIEAGIADGKMIKADFTYMTSLFDEINALIDNDPNKLIPSESGRFQGIYYGFYMSCKNNGNHSQFDYDRNMADNDYEGQIEGVLAGIKDGTALKADYTEIDEAIASLDEKLADVNLTDEAKAELEEIKTQLTEMKNNPLSSKADVEELMKAVEELEAGVEDGTIVLVDASKIFAEYDIAHSDDLEEKYGKEKVDKVFFKIHIKNPEVIDSIWEYADSITGTVAETADEIEEIKRMFDNLYEGVERCIIGTHNIEEYEVISPAKCGVNAIESATCTLCCDELTREVENSALTHSFTEYEVVDAPTCGKAGKKVAACDNGCGAADEKEIEALTHSFTEYEVVEEPTCGKVGKEAATCDNGCGATDEKEIPTLEHIFLEYKSNDDATCTADGTKTAECENGCGETDTVTDEGTMLDHTDEDGDKICDDCQAEIIDVCPDCGGAVHEGQLAEYICTLVTLIKLIVSLVQFIQQFTA